MTDAQKAHLRLLESLPRRTHIQRIRPCQPRSPGRPPNTGVPNFRPISPELREKKREAMQRYWAERKAAKNR